MSKPSLTTRMQLIKVVSCQGHTQLNYRDSQGQAILRTNRVQIAYKMRTFFRKICAKVLVSEDYVLKKEKLLTGYIKGSFLFNRRDPFLF